MVVPAGSQSSDTIGESQEGRELKLGGTHPSSFLRKMKNDVNFLIGEKS